MNHISSITSKVRKETRTMAIDKNRKMKTSSNVVGLSSEDFETPTTQEKPKEQTKKKYKPVRCNFYIPHDLFISLDLISKFNESSRGKIFVKAINEFVNKDESQEQIKKQKEIATIKKGN